MALKFVEEKFVEDEGNKSFSSPSIASTESLRSPFHPDISFLDLTFSLEVTMSEYLAQNESQFNDLEKEKDVIDKLRETDYKRLADEVYVDYMGGSLYPESLIRVHTAFLQRHVLGNTHSVNNS